MEPVSVVRELSSCKVSFQNAAFSCQFCHATCDALMDVCTSMTERGRLGAPGLRSCVCARWAVSGKNKLLRACSSPRPIDSPILEGQG